MMSKYTYECSYVEGEYGMWVYFVDSSDNEVLKIHVSKLEPVAWITGSDVDAMIAAQKVGDRAKSAVLDKVLRNSDKRKKREERDEERQAKKIMRRYGI